MNKKWFYSICGEEKAWCNRDDGKCIPEQIINMSPQSCIYRIYNHPITNESYQDFVKARKFIKMVK